MCDSDACQYKRRDKTALAGNVELKRDFGSFHASNVDELIRQTPVSHRDGCVWWWYDEQQSASTRKAANRDRRTNSSSSRDRTGVAGAGGRGRETVPQPTAKRPQFVRQCGCAEGL